MISAKPFNVEVSARAATFTFFAPVPGAEYLQPTQRFVIPKRNWMALVADGGPRPGTATFCNFTPEQLKAHGVATKEAS
ncbi:MAG: hypothetical protein MUF81_10035 [Verrucomicrobia bacterium]|nr:hypothetical protein [Verrucomicrobiota bacterium]